MRQNVERSFGIMTSKWGIFWRPLQVAHERWPLIIVACAKLHNFCIDEGISANETDVCLQNNDILRSNIHEGDMLDVYTSSNGQNSSDDTENMTRRSIPNNSTRQRLTEHLERNGWKRPQYLPDYYAI